MFVLVGLSPSRTRAPGNRRYVDGLLSRTSSAVMASLTSDLNNGMVRGIRNLANSVRARERRLRPVSVRRMMSQIMNHVTDFGNDGIVSAFFDKRQCCASSPRPSCCDSKQGCARGTWLGLALIERHLTPLTSFQPDPRTFTSTHTMARRQRQPRTNNDTSIEDILLIIVALFFPPITALIGQKLEIFGIAQS